ncbi:enoyl-CoA hydratase/isomerase family protein, partial [Streptomyces sp. uw30]
MKLALTQFTVVEVLPGYWRATFDHPPINLMTAVTAAELRAIVEAAEMADDLRVLVFDSANPDFFFARYDLSAGPLPSEPGPTGLPAFLDITVRLGDLRAITVAQIEGRARGGGNELALACDLRYAALETAVLGQPEIGSALVPAGGGLERLVPLVGRSRTLEIAATGDDYDASTAERYGWVTRALPAVELPGHVDALARTRTAGPPGRPQPHPGDRCHRRRLRREHGRAVRVGHAGPARRGTPGSRGRLG